MCNRYRVIVQCPPRVNVTIASIGISGHSVTAATSSIPSKYQTVVIKNNDKKGFQSKSKRFTYDSDIVSC